MIKNSATIHSTAEIQTTTDPHLKVDAHCHANVEKRATYVGSPPGVRSASAAPLLVCRAFLMSATTCRQFY
jgi:hypothetical protein